MLSFLLGISITINILFIVVFVVYLKIKSTKSFFKEDFVVDKQIAMEFFGKN